MTRDALMRWVSRGLCLLCVTLLASCCGTPIHTVRTVTVHEPVIVPVPAVYTQPIAAPVLTANPTNADLAHYALLLRQALSEANARLHAIAGLHH